MTMRTNCGWLRRSAGLSACLAGLLLCGAVCLAADPVPTGSTNAVDPPPVGLSLGSSTNDVATIMGMPTSVERGVGFEDWNFGKSSVRFQDGRVTRWSNLGELKVSLEGEPADAIWMGCPTNQVAQVLGQPDRVIIVGSREVWHSGVYSFRFDDGKLVELSAATKIEGPKPTFPPPAAAVASNPQLPSATPPPTHTNAVASTSNTAHHQAPAGGYYRHNGTYVPPNARAMRRR